MFFKKRTTTKTIIPFTTSFFQKMERFTHLSKTCPEPNHLISLWLNHAKGFEIHSLKKSVSSTPAKNNQVHSYKILFFFYVIEKSKPTRIIMPAIEPKQLFGLQTNNDRKGRRLDKFCKFVFLRVRMQKTVFFTLQLKYLQSKTPTWHHEVINHDKTGCIGANCRVF